MMTSPIASQGGLKVGRLYSFINEITTFFMITKKRAKISSLNFLCIGIMRFMSTFIYTCVFMTSLMPSLGLKVGQILTIAQNVGNPHGYLTSIYNFRYNIRWKRLLRPETGGHFENFEILNTAVIWPQQWKDHPKLCQNSIFHDDDVIDDITGWPQSFPTYSCLVEVGSGSKLQGQGLVNKCK